MSLFQISGLSFFVGDRVVWAGLYAVGLRAAVRARRTSAPGAGRAVWGFGVLFAASAVMAGTAALQAGNRVFGGTRIDLALWDIAMRLVCLIGQGLLVAAFLSAWRAASDPPPE